jgi:UDP-N-acetylglucosamine/UDP-N-acetylgalactosamine diphosphorylase
VQIRVWRAGWLIERVGVLCLKDGKPTVVEYSEFPPDLMHLRDEQGGPFLRGHIEFFFFFNVADFMRVYACA